MMTTCMAVGKPDPCSRSKCGGPSLAKDITVILYSTVMNCIAIYIGVINTAIPVTSTTVNYSDYYINMLLLCTFVVRFIGRLRCI